LEAPCSTIRLLFFLERRAVHLLDGMLFDILKFGGIQRTSYRVIRLFFSHKIKDLKCKEEERRVGGEEKYSYIQRQVPGPIHPLRVSLRQRLFRDAETWKRKNTGEASHTGLV
jgi:hypothetical protein